MADVRVESDLAPIADVGRAPRHVAEVPDPDSEYHSESPGLQKPEHGKHATIAASFAQRPSHELSTLVASQQQV